MTEKSKPITQILLAGIIVLLIININSGRRISRLEQQIHSISQSQFSGFMDVQNARHTLFSVEHRLNELYQQIERGTRLSFDESVLIQAYHATTTSADIEVSFNLREHNPAHTISVTARGQDGQTHGATVTAENGRFMAAMTLPVQDNYVLTFTSSGDTVITGELMHFNLADQLCNRFRFHMDHGTSSGTNIPTTINLHPHFRNQTLGNPALNVTSLTLYIETEDGDIITYWDLTHYLQYTTDGQMLYLEWGAWFERAMPDDRFTLTVGDEAGNISPNDFTHSRLVIRDGLGIKYEQVDIIAFPGQFNHIGGRGSSRSMEVAPMPMREVAWRAGDTTITWGRVLIVE